MALFCRPVLTAPALVRRNGAVLADAWLPDLADVPFALDWHIPTGKVITEWRLLIPHATETKTTVTGKPRVTVFAPGFS